MGEHVEIRFSTGLGNWLSDHNCSLALTTFRSGKLVFVGRDMSGQITFQNCQIDHCQGLWSDGQSLIVSSLHMLWRFENGLQRGAISEDGADRKFMPRQAYVTGQIDIHDVAVGDLTAHGGSKQAPIFVSTAFNCLATTSAKANFRPLWHPPFIDRVVGEDRCHLNGMAMRGGDPAYVTCVSTSNTASGWREHRTNGGVLLDRHSGDVILANLSMPHSPRLWMTRIWLLDSGRGHLISVDFKTGDRTVVASIPGYARGLSFIDRFAVIGVSRPRSSHAFSGLELDGNLKKQGVAPTCGVVIVDTLSGIIVEWMEFAQPIDEVYDVVVLPDCKQPICVALESEQARTRVTIE